MENLSQNVKNFLYSIRSSSQSYGRTGQESGGDESLLDGEKHSDANDPTPLQPSIRSRPWLKYLLILAGVAIYSSLLLVFFGQRCSDHECGKRTSIWSPLNEALEYVEYDFNTAFDQKSKYRGPPSVEIEAAWNMLLLLDPVPYPEDKLRLANRTDGVLGGLKLARLEEEPGAPVAANFEVFHQLHCLNYIRQYTWRDWYFRHPEAVKIPLDMLSSDVGVRMHADHCIDTIRETLICHGDTTPFFTVVDPDQPQGARGDFNAHHKCRDFGKLQEWMKEHSVRQGSGVGGQGHHHG